MVQSWGFHDVISWNSPAWFVSVEFFLYLDISYQHGTWRGLADFGIGVALGSLFLARRSREAGGKTLPTRMHTLAQIGALAAVAAALCGSGPARTPRDLMLAVPIFALVFLLAFDRGLIARALHAPWLMKLGEWSFAIYMVHYIVMYVVASLIVRESFWLACLAGIVGSIAAGGLAWRFIERPVGEAMRRRLLSAWASRRSR